MIKRLLTKIKLAFWRWEYDGCKQEIDELLLDIKFLSKSEAKLALRDVYKEQEAANYALKQIKELENELK